MAYYIKKQGLSGREVYWTGGNRWSDDFDKKKTYVNKGTASNRILNMEGTNGGFTGAEVVLVPE